MVKQFAGVLAFVLFAASMVLLLPRLVYANTGTPPTLTILDGSPSATANPVPVGVSGTGPFTTVTFQVNVTAGNEQNESGPVSVKNQQYTISGGGGMIVGVGAPQGYTTTPTTIPTTGLGSVTVTGSGSNSFQLSATLFFPQSAAGEDTVTCSGVLNLTDGTQVESSPSGSVQVAAVAVDSIALADDPSTVQIGQTLTRSDFTITTTPSGYGNYQAMGSNETPGPYLVTLSPASFQVAIGDNIVTASCGASSASVDVIGVEEASSWTSSSFDYATGLVTNKFTAEINGINGTYSVTGPNVVGGDTSGQLAEDVPFTGTVTMDPSSDGTDYATVSTPSSESGTSGSSALMASRAAVVGGPALAVKSAGSLFWDAVGVVTGVAGAAGKTAGVITGAVVYAAHCEFLSEDVQIIPKSLTELLSLTTANPNNYTPAVNQVTSTCTWSASGYSRWGIVGGYYYTVNPKFQVNCSPPTMLGREIYNGPPPVPFVFDTTSFIDIPTVPLGQFPSGEGTAFCNGNPNGLTDTANNATEVKGSFSGSCGIVSDDGEGTLFTSPNAPGVVAGPPPLPSSQTINVNWSY